MSALDTAFEQLIDEITIGHPLRRDVERTVLKYLANYHLTLAWDTMEDHVKEITGKPMTLDVYRYINLEMGWSGFDDDIMNFIEDCHELGRI